MKKVSEVETVDYIIVETKKPKHLFIRLILALIIFYVFMSFITWTLSWPPLVGTWSIGTRIICVLFVFGCIWLASAIILIVKSAKT